VSDFEELSINFIGRAGRKHSVVGKDPSRLVVAALCLVSRLSKENIAQSRLAETADVTEFTIRNRKQDLMKRLNPNSVDARMTGVKVETYGFN